jgi:hypothetical protein
VQAQRRQSSVRDALGESKTEMAKLAEAETVTAASLDAMSAYARAQELQIAGGRGDSRSP